MAEDRQIKAGQLLAYVVAPTTRTRFAGSYGKGSNKTLQFGITPDGSIVYEVLHHKVLVLETNISQEACDKYNSLP